MHGRKGKLHVHACSYKEWTWWARKSRYLDIRGVSSSGEVRVDHLSLVQVSFHELGLNKASSCVHVSVGACMARHGPTWSKPSLVGLQYGLPVYCAKYSLRWRSEFMILVLNKSTLFRKRIWKKHNMTCMAYTRDEGSRLGVPQYATAHHWSLHKELVVANSLEQIERFLQPVLSREWERSNGNYH